LLSSQTPRRTQVRLRRLLLSALPCSASETIVIANHATKL